MPEPSPTARPAPDHGPALRPMATAARWAEMLGLFVAVPLLYAGGVVRVPLFPALLVAALAALIVLLRSPTFDRGRLLNVRGAVRDLPWTLGAGLLAAAAIFALVLTLTPATLLALPRERPVLWLAITLLYPLLSAYPQEVVFRAFFFHRYACLLRRPAAMIAVNAAVFGLAHAFYKDALLAVVLSAAAGVLFAASYARSRSLLSAWLLHALVGWLAFTLGLGRLFYETAARVG